jgi:outer membrane protein assembly factor BamA
LLIAVTDLKIDGDIQDVAAVQTRILKSLEGREFDSDSEGLEEIGEVIRAEFQDSGYFRVVLSNLRSEPLDAERHRVLVTVNVEEGEQYRTGHISIVSGQLDNVIRVKRNTGAATVNVLLDFSATTRPN